MKTRSFSAMGAMHPVLFFAGVYIVVLLFSIFICSALFYSCNTSPSKGLSQSALPANQVPATNSTAAIVLR